MIFQCLIEVGIRADEKGYHEFLRHSLLKSIREKMEDFWISLVTKIILIVLVDAKDVRFG